ncbi:hypothetical protein OsI_00317 [Oryza sativa Indica Group]|uniref:Uncharacterized protein n=1 Tax=Oryza sativa subsp. indica TaxID=39946 RepID=A2WKG7_ORYSI|nr:hypothetical protein OsI_00317 [Oryza sativa Indica Group]
MPTASRPGSTPLHLAAHAGSLTASRDGALEGSGDRAGAEEAEIARRICVEGEAEGALRDRLCPPSQLIVTALKTSLPPIPQHDPRELCWGHIGPRAGLLKVPLSSGTAPRDICLRHISPALGPLVLGGHEEYKV